MTIDDRLARLTERHEALTQVVELLARDIRGISDSTIRLVEVAQNHERRLKRLED